MEQLELAVNGSEQNDTAVAGHAVAIKSTFHDTSAKTAELDRHNVNYFGTVGFGIARSSIKIRHLVKRDSQGNAVRASMGVPEISGSPL